MESPGAEEKPGSDKNCPGGGESLAAPSYIVGIGASAGGFAALRTLFAAMPPDLGVSFVVVMHPSPCDEGRLDELLRSATKMPVRLVVDAARLEPDHVYVIPRNANLGTIDTHLRLSSREERRAERAPIDHLLRTLAISQEGKAIAITLTGSGTDGALGVRQIREHGGLTIAQDPAEAASDSMPRAAVATGAVDLILKLRDIPERVSRYCATRPRLPMIGGKAVLTPADKELLEEIIELLNLNVGEDISVYKSATVLRRIRRRMQLRHVATLGAYFDVFRQLPEESRALHDDIVISAAEFFAEGRFYERLESRIIPQLFDNKNDSRECIRLWSIGCSTGEDAYSLAMLLLEEAARRARPPRLQVFATDVADDVVLRAREGVYPLEVGATIAEARLEKFFVEEDGHYRVRREVRDVVIFATQNVLRDPPFLSVDLIVCRRLLGDLEPAVRQGVVNILYHSLNPNGHLVLGPDDSIGQPDLFELDDEHAHIYRRRPEPRPPNPIDVPMPELRRARGAGASVPVAPFGEDLGTIHERLTGPLAPASLLVDQQNQVVHYSPRAGAFIRMPGGAPTNDVLQLVAEPLRSQLRLALRTVRRKARPWMSGTLYVSTDGKERRVVLKVEPVSKARPGELTLVVFDEPNPDIEALPAVAEPQLDAVRAIAALQSDLAETEQRLRRMLEERTASDSAETLEAEDLRIFNEELRSSLEELETSKDELRAANGELLALDAENRRQIGELAQLSGDLKHLLESTGIAMLFLDRELRIVRFTPQLAEVFNVRVADRGRPLSDLTHGLAYDELASDALMVLSHLEPHEREVESRAGRWYLARILPYRSPRNEVEGVVLALIDITDRKLVEDRLRLADRRKDEFLALLAHELRNPLAPIVSGVEILKMAASDPSVVEKVATTIGRQTQLLVRLVDDLLEVSRISGGRLKLSKAPLRLQDVVRDSIAAARPMIDRAGHDLEIRVPEEPVVVDGDGARLTQALGNLLNNAARYTPKGGRIALTLTHEGEAAVVVVEDNGSGIPEEVRGRVFEMFFQGDNARGSRNTGLGIGLTLAKSLIEMHGGSIGVTSGGKDCGSRFTLRLPIAASAVLTQKSAAGESPAPEGRRVLVVDDNRDAAETLCMLVKTIGDNDVRVAFSGAEALEIAAGQHPEIAFLDLKMPEMDGYEIARRIREQPWGADATLVALTGFGQEEHKRRTKEAGFDRHLTKPAERAAVEAVLSGQPRERQSAAS